MSWLADIQEFIAGTDKPEQATDRQRWFLRMLSEKEDADPYGGAFFRFYRFGLEKAIKLRVLTVLGTIALIASIVFLVRWLQGPTRYKSTRVSFIGGHSS